MRTTRMRGVWLAMLGSALCAPPISIAASGPSYGVYIEVLEAPLGAYAAVTTALPTLLTQAGWKVEATHELGTGDCSYKARVYVVTEPTWTAAIARGGMYAAFMVPLRIAVYQDELGTHVALANPQSLSRTVISEQGYDAAATAVVTRLQAALAGAPGKPVARQYGQLRERGLIDKTMGVVAGGPFSSKIEEIGAVKATATLSVAEVAKVLGNATRAPTTRWGLRAVYQVDLPGGMTSIIGFGGDKMEAKSFAIVGNGSDGSRAGYRCPGIDHAAAFPIEVVVHRDGPEIRLLIIDEMFRMKMYFEDAGKMKFAANMAMPGSIENEIRDLAEDALYLLRGRSASR